jgi:hypothetical protein
MWFALRNSFSHLEANSRAADWGEKLVIINMMFRLFTMIKI